LQCLSGSSQTHRNVSTEDPVPRELSSSELESFSSLDWFHIAPQVTPAVRSSLENILATQNGNAITQEEAYALAHAEGDDLLGLLTAANLLRAELSGNLITYVVNRNINFTNICFVGCKFCAFSRGPRESDTYFLNPEEVGQKAIEAWQLGATEVCVQGGLPHGLPPFYYRDILRAVKNAVPAMHIHAFSPMEIVYGVELTGMPLGDYLAMLRDDGLGTLPGTAAEILDDEVRKILSANKLSTAQWIEVIRTAHRLGIRTTSTMMYGHTETAEHWVRQMQLLRDIQDETGGFTEFVPLGFVHQNTLLFHQGLARSGPTLAEHLKVHALSRLLLAGSINNIQVSWVKLNRRLSQLCLHAGANDYGGTLMEENISREAGATAGQYTSPQDFQSFILEMGRIPAERNTTYTRIKLKSPVEDYISEETLEPQFA
jgi:7,8-didemethyl-8-hydroxy-5-deazariboflavin synthase CofH subunit